MHNLDTAMCISGCICSYHHSLVKLPLINERAYVIYVVVDTRNTIFASINLLQYCNTEGTQNKTMTIVNSQKSKLVINDCIYECKVYNTISSYCPSRVHSFNSLFPGSVGNFVSNFLL